MPQGRFPTNRHLEKRKTQEKQTVILKEHGFQNGTIIVLSGPNPHQAIDSYQKYSICKDCILAEQNKSTFENIQEVPKNSILIREDIFNLLEIFSESIEGIDLDLCGTFSFRHFAKVIKSIERLSKEKIWLRITSSVRALTTAFRSDFPYYMPKDSYDAIRVVQEVFVELISKKFEVIDFSNDKYFDTTPMSSWQLVVKKKIQ